MRAHTSYTFNNNNSNHQYLEEYKKNKRKVLTVVVCVFVTYTMSLSHHESFVSVAFIPSCLLRFQYDTSDMYRGEKKNGVFATFSMRKLLER